jgi:diguanylate cyclase (GGDEF)-like protein
VTNAEERRASPAARGPRAELDGLVQHVALADWLVLLVVLLYAALATAGDPPWPLAAAIGAFLATSILLRVPPLSRRSPELRLTLRVWLTAAFIAYVAWQTGGADSPLVSLFLLPVVLAALVLPGVALAVLLVAIALAYALAARVRPGLELGTAAFAGRLLGAVGPFVIVAWLTSQLGTQVLAARRRARELADTDGLTGLVNLRVFTDTVQQQIQAAERRSAPVAVLVADVEKLRVLNEQHGLEAGNAALELVANVLRRALRETDLAARSGGGEFLLLLPGADIEAAHKAGSRLRTAVQAANFSSGGKVLRVSVSFGAAIAPRDGRDARDLIATAERRCERDRELRRGPAAAAS